MPRAANSQAGFSASHFMRQSEAAGKDGKSCGVARRIPARDDE
jgi:hypothetical protein